MADYVVKINRQEGVLEVSAPDKEWVDTKIEQLAPQISAGPLPATGGSTRTRPRSARRRAGGGTDAAAGQNGAEKSAPRRRASGRKAQVDEDLRARLTPEVRERLKDYIAARRAKFDAGLSAQAAIIATFLHDELDHPGVDQDDLYTVYTVMGERIPGNISSQLVNARQRSRYFAAVSDGKSILSHAGENFARFDSLNSASGETADES